MEQKFEMVAKTMQGLEEVLAEELRDLGALNVEPGRRMVSFEGDLETLYKANMCCRTALRILKPICKFTASDPDTLYEQAKEFDWGSLMSVDSTFAIDAVVYSDEFTHSRYVTYRVKDAVVDWFQDRLGEGKRPGVRLQDADVIINVYISGCDVTLSLDSSGESLHKRGYRVAQTDAPINEVLAAGMILRSGWRGDCPLIDPMCGSGTFLIEAALIAANINPGVFRRGFAFEHWPDFDSELFDRIYNDDSAEREMTCRIYGADMSAKAIAIARENIKSAGVARYIDLQQKQLSQWDEAPEGGVLITNPPYGERISAPDMEGLYKLLGTKLKHVFTGYHAWIIGYRQEYFDCIGLSPSVKIPVLNGSLECEIREYIIFEGRYDEFRKAGGHLRGPVDDTDDDTTPVKPRNDKRERREDRRESSRRSHSSDRREFKSDRRESHDSRRRPERGARDERYDRDRKKPSRPPRKERPDRVSNTDFNPENPLSLRRNPHALKSLSGKRPTLPPAGPVMRRRRNKD